MKVGELIEILKKYPKDLPILAEHDFWIYDLEEECFEIKKISVSETSGNYIDTDGISEYFKPDDIFEALVLKQGEEK